MSKIAEQKALEAYPPEYEQEDFDETWDMNIQYREPYIKGYDQAIQDFLEKAEKFFNSELYVSVSDQICSMNEFKTMKDFVNYFKNYMQDEM